VSETAEIGPQSRNITAAQPQLIQLLCSDNPDVQLAALDFLEKGPIPLADYSNLIAQHPRGLSSTFYFSLESKLRENNRSTADRLLSVVSAPEEPLNDGQLRCHRAFVRSRWFAPNELSAVSAGVLGRFFIRRAPL
jgi:hypothetical protein